MKICDLTCLYYPRGGGIKTYIDNKRRIYKERQISHILIAPNFKDKNKVKKISDGSLVVYYVPCFKLTLAKTSYYIFKKFNKIHEILEQEKPDVIEIGDKITTLLYKNKIKKIRSCINAKIFAFSHERADNFAGRVIANGFLANRLADFFTKRFIGSAEYVITNSNFTAEEIKRYLPPKKIFVVELGIDAVDFIREKYFDAKLREQLSAGDKKNIIIHIGRLDKEKKIELLVEIAKKFDHEKFNLVVVGGGGHEDDLKAIKSVYFAGYVPYSEVKRYLAVSDLGILVNNIEPYGLVGLEMMAMGLPILGPNAGGLTTFLRKEFAWLLPFDSDSYLKALDDWLEMADEEKSKKSQSAFLEARKYSLEKMVDKLLSIYNSV